MNRARSAETVLSLDVLLNEVKVGTIVRTPGDFNAFSFDPAYRASGGHPVLSLSFRAATGGLRKDPRPVAGALPPFKPRRRRSQAAASVTRFTGHTHEQNSRPPSRR